jgi:hypothetical protein
MWMNEIAEMLAAELGPLGYRVPTRPLPYWLMWIAARFDRTLRLALDYVGVPSLVSADKAKQELAWAARPARESILATAESLLRCEVVPRRGADTHARPLRRLTSAAGEPPDQSGPV